MKKVVKMYVLTEVRKRRSVKKKYHDGRNLGCSLYKENRPAVVKYSPSFFVTQIRGHIADPDPPLVPLR